MAVVTGVFAMAALKSDGLPRFQTLTNSGESRIKK
jgi:hypothetical protein